MGFTIHHGAEVHGLHSRARAVRRFRVGLFLSLSPTTLVRVKVVVLGGALIGMGCWIGLVFEQFA